MLSGGTLYSQSYNINTLDNPSPGYLFFNTSSTSLEFVDNSGNKIFQKNLLGNSGIFARLENGNWARKEKETFYIFDNNFNFIDSIENPTASYTKPLSLDWHEIISLKNGHYLLLLTKTVIKDMSKVIEDGNSEAILITNVLIETDFNGEIFWEWDALDHLNITDVSNIVDLTQKQIDLTHINSFVEDNDGNIIVSIRNYDEIVKINKITGEFIWRFGGSTSKNNQFNIINDELNGFKGFSHQHCISLLDNGNILLFDNGNAKIPPYSRAVEYQLNYDEKTAHKVWESRKTPDIFLPSLGSVQRFENGSTLINWGKYGISEVNALNKVTFDLTYKGLSSGTYKAERIISDMDGILKKVTSANLIDFSDNTYKTNVKLDLLSINDSGFISVEKHYYKPYNLEFVKTIFDSIINNRWVISSSNLISCIGTLRFNLSNFQDIDRSKISILYRNKEGLGKFSELKNIFIPEAKELISEFEGFGEYILANLTINGIPEFNSYLNGKIVQLSDSISWSKINNSEKFQIQISTDSTFISELYNFIIDETNFNLLDLEPGTKYFSRVRALNSKDTSLWSKYLVFFTKLDSPKLIFPNADEIVDLNEDTLRWSDFKPSVKYRLQISNDSIFKSNEIDLVDLPYSFYKFGNYKENFIYYWRVLAYTNNDTSSWSEVRRFKFVNKEKPLVELLSPENNSTKMNTSIKLEWVSISESEKYYFRLSNDPNFDKVIFQDQTIKINSIVCSDLEFEKDYFWSVAVLINGNLSDFAKPFRFTTKMNKPEIIFPLNNSVEIPFECKMQWVRKPNTSCIINIASDSSFNEIILDSLVGDVAELLLNLEKGKWHFLRMKFVNDSNESNWSDTIHFKTNEVNSVVNLEDVKCELLSDRDFRKYILLIQVSYYELYLIEMFDIFGNRLNELNNDYLIPGINKFEINVQSLSPGMYFLKIKNNKIIKIEKFMLN